MDMTVLIFLSSGLFLGWSLGANDAANVFGTAVGSRMIRFTTAAAICSVFLILGAVISGAGAAHGLGKLGSLNALPGAFMAAFSAALTVYWMTKASLPVSTTQAVVGAIIGWNWFSDSITDLGALFKILGTWVACPILGAIFGALLYKLTVNIITWAKVHMLHLDLYTRLGLIVAGAFGSYSLGANNIGNVMGVFVNSSPFTEFSIGDSVTISSVQQLFFVGAVAIGVGVFTYSKRVMMMVGEGLMPLTPIAAWVVVISQSIVLFLFSSITLEHFLASNGLPTIPLIPVSSSQAVVGSVIGIGLLKGGKGIRWGSVASITSGWVTTPIIAAIVCFVSLFFLQNVFNQEVYKEVRYVLSEPVMIHLEQKGVVMTDFSSLKDQEVAGGVHFRDLLRSRVNLDDKAESRIIAAAEIHPLDVTATRLRELDRDYLTTDQVDALERLVDRRFRHRWQLYEALAELNPEWQRKEDSKLYKPFNKHLTEQLGYLYSLFAVSGEQESDGF